MESNSVKVFCVNCGSASSCRVLDDEQILECIQHWVAPRLVQAHDLVCTVCWTEAKTTVAANKVIVQKCALCKETLANQARKHQVIALRTDTPHQVNIQHILLERLGPLKIRPSHSICHPCWQKADRAAMRLPSTCSTSSNKLKCVNCLIDVTRLKRHILNNETILLQIQKQLALQTVTAADYICNACHALFVNNAVVKEGQIRMVGHVNICIRCGRSVKKLRHFVVHKQNQHILKVAQNWIHPREIQPSDVICHGCYLVAKDAPHPDAVLMHNPAPQAGRIFLPNYMRCPDTHSRCIFPGCNTKRQQTVPSSIRVRLFRDHKYYIPPTCRICQTHLESELWSVLFEGKHVHHTFTAQHIEDFWQLLKKAR